MTDIVERLRVNGLPPPEILEEAADEIEFLYRNRRDNAELINNLEAEIERLQAVIASHHEFFEGAKANLNDARNLIATLRAELREAGLLR